MTYLESLEKANTVKWETFTCTQGKKCWCRAIRPIEPIFDKDNNEVIIVKQGELHKIHAKYIVKLHNKSLKK